MLDTGCEVKFGMFDSESNTLQRLMSANKQPRMFIRLAAPTKEQKELLELVLLRC